VAHDFNNILTVIQGHASILRANPALTGDMKRSVKPDFAFVRTRHHLTRQLLTFSRKQATQPRVLDFERNRRQPDENAQNVLRADVVLQVDYGPNLFLVRADAGMMEQVLMNLAINARDAMPHGGKLIIGTSKRIHRAGIRAVESSCLAGNCVCLAVTDAGEGIAPEVLPRIFEPFFYDEARRPGNRPWSCDRVRNCPAT